MTPFRDSCSQLPFTTCCFMTTPSCNPATDRQTVSTHQHHLPSVPTLTLINFLGTFSTAWPSPSSYYPPPCPPPLVGFPDTPSGSPPAPGASTPPPPPARPPATIPTFITPSAPPSIPPVWEHVIAVLMKLPPPLQRAKT